MVESNDKKGNGHKSDADDMTVYEPAFAPGSDDETEPVGWWKTESGEEDGEFAPDLPPELDDKEPPSSN